MRATLGYIMEIAIHPQHANQKCAKSYANSTTRKENHQFTFSQKMFFVYEGKC
jgi:hypothetical protein